MEYRRSKKAKEPPIIDIHLTLGFHGKRTLTIPSSGKAPGSGLLGNRIGVASGKAPCIACSVNAAVGPNLHRNANTAVSRELPQRKKAGIVNLSKVRMPSIL